MNGVDNDIYLSQNDFNKAAGLADVDATYDKFLSRILKGYEILSHCLNILHQNNYDIVM
jgi:hypothetical protein